MLKQQQQLENTALGCHLAMGQGGTTRALDEAEAASLGQSPATGTSGDSSIRVMMPPSHLEPEGDYAEADLECMPAFLSDSDSEGITMAAVAAAALVKALSQAGHALTVTTLGDSRVCAGASPDHKRVRHAGTDVATWRPVADLLRDHTHVDLMLRHKVGRPTASATAICQWHHSAAICRWLRVMSAHVFEGCVRVRMQYLCVQGAASGGKVSDS